MLSASLVVLMSIECKAMAFPNEVFIRPISLVVLSKFFESSVHTTVLSIFSILLKNFSKLGKVYILRSCEEEISSNLTDFGFIL